MNENEIWKPIPGYEGLYEASNMGRVKSLLKRIILKNQINIKKKKDRPSYSYTVVCIKLYKEGKEKFFIISRLVAMTFIPNPEGLPEVDHRDQNPLNNNVDNLRWATKSVNGHNRKATGFDFIHKTGKYKARITINSKKKHIGVFDTPEEAKVAYDKVKSEYWESIKV